MYVINLWVWICISKHGKYFENNRYSNILQNIYVPLFLDLYQVILDFVIGFVDKSNTVINFVIILSILLIFNITSLNLCFISKSRTFR